MIRFACPKCQQVLQAAPEQAGAIISCPRCKSQMRAPQAAPTAAPGAARPSAAPPPRTAPNAIQPAPTARPPAPPPAPPRPPAVARGGNGQITASPPSTASAPAAVPAAERPPWGKRILGWGKTALIELGKTGAATWSQTVRLTAYCRHLFRRRSLRKQAASSELAPGESLYAARGGDPQLRQKVAALDQQIQTAEANKGKTKPFKTERQALLQQLGAIALAQKALPPGVEAERARAQDSRMALLKQDEHVKSVRKTLPPSGKTAWLRVGAGYATICGVLVVSLVLAAGGRRKSKDGDLAGASLPPDLNRIDSAVKWIPADAAFFVNSLHHREQYQALTSSRAWTKAQELPGFKQGWASLQKEWNDPRGDFAPLRKFFDQPDNRPLLDLLLDMVSQEVFIYGGDSTADFVEALPLAPMAMEFVQLSGQKPDQPQEALLGALLRTLNKRKDQIKVPELILGFKLSDSKRAEEQISRLEKIAAGLKMFVPELPEFKRSEVAGSSFLTLTVDGSMVPWRMVPLETIQESPGQFNDLIKKLTSLKLTLAMGVRDGYLLVSLGESTNSLERLGRGERLLDRPEFKRLLPHANERLTTISYGSQKWNAVSLLGLGAGDMEKGLKSITDLPASWGATPKQKEQLLKDLNQIGEDLKSFASKPGASLSFSFGNSRGLQNYEFDWGDYPLRDSSKPLSLLNHVGESPVMFAIGRSKFGVEHYQKIAQWIKVFDEHFKALVLPQVPKMLEAMKTPLPAGAGVFVQRMYLDLSRVLTPFLKELDKVTAESFLPALADGQTGIVLDAKLTSKQWFPNQPPSAKELPMLEPALIVSVTDKEKLEKAGREYRSVLNDMLAKLGIPNLPTEVPAPQSQTVPSGTLYYYALPPIPGLDKRLMPTIGVSDRVAVLTISKEHAERLMTPTPVQHFGGPLSDLNRPLAGAFFMNLESYLDVVIAWQQATKPNDPNKDLLELLKIFKAASSCTYRDEDGVWVTRGEVVIQDR